MTTISCPNCGANLTVTQSVRIAEYHFGKLVKANQQPSEGPGFIYQLEKADTYTIICNACKRLVRTLPISNTELT